MGLWEYYKNKRNTAVFLNGYLGGEERMKKNLILTVLIFIVLAISGVSCGDGGCDGKGHYSSSNSDNSEDEIKYESMTTH